MLGGPIDWLVLQELQGHARSLHQLLKKDGENTHSLPPGRSLTSNFSLISNLGGLYVDESTGRNLISKLHSSARFLNAEERVPKVTKEDILAMTNDTCDDLPLSKVTL
jgi:hypothetical protein